MSQLRIVADTREQILYNFPEDVEVIRRCLLTADYSLENDFHFAIEAKSLDDFLGTISSGWERFKCELQRMENQEFVAKVIIVEGDFENCLFKEEDGKIIPPQHNHFKLTPQFIISRIATLTLMNVSVLFAGNIGYASALAYHILKKREKGLNSENKSQN